jgi:hypothetical protein
MERGRLLPHYIQQARCAKAYWEQCQATSDCSLSLRRYPYTGTLLMAWWHEIRDTDDRLMELRRGFATEDEALETGQLAKKMIQPIVSQETESLAIVTGPDSPNESQKRLETCAKN